MLDALSATCRKKIALLAVIISAFVLLAPGAFAAQDKSLYSLVPLASPVTASVDVPWLWKTTAGLRNNPMAGSGLQAMQASLGLSFENDVLPWAGQAAFAVTDVHQDGPSFALFVQIRDAEHMIPSARLEAVLQRMLAGQSRINWSAMDYKGVAIRRTEITRGKSVLKVAMATVDGWLVIAVGDGVIRKVIDTSNGAIPSLASHPSFVRAMGDLPDGAVGQFCVNGQGILTQIQQYDASMAPLMAQQLKDSEVGKFFIAGAMTDPDNNLQFDAVYCSTSPTTQATLKQLRADAGTVSGASLARLPEGAFATLLIPNPDKWVAAVEQLFVDAAGSDSDARAKIQQRFANIDGLRAVLQRCPGELGISGAWREGQGFGVTVAGQAGTPDDATSAAAALSSFLEKQQMKVDNKDGLYTLPATKGGVELFSTLVCWTTRQQWLLAASHPDWVAQPAVKPPLELPSIANNANFAAFGNFSFVPSLAKSLGVNGMMLAMLAPALGQWSLAMKIDDDGGAVRSHVSGGGLFMTATMASVLYPVFAKAREKARQTASLSNLRQLAIAVQTYEMDKGHLPVMKSAFLKKELNVDDPLLRSPNTNESYTPNPIISGKASGQFAYPATMIVFYEKTPASDGSRCAAFLDGHVAVIRASEWAAAKRRAKIP